MKAPLFYHKKPVFGLDIGSKAVKIMQLESSGKHAHVRGYGSIGTDDKIMKDGVISNIPGAAKLIDELLADNIIGSLTTNRVVMSIPVSRVFTRVLTLPLMSKKELSDAVQLEVEQSVPVAPKNLYFDYETTDIGDPNNILVRMVAVPKVIVDSYSAVCELLNLDLALIQTNIRADAQLCKLYEDLESNNPYIILDVGGNAIDIGILDETLRVTGTVDEGGDGLTNSIAKALHVSPDKAHHIKVTQGLGAGAQQKKILTAVSPILDKVIKEIEKMVRFHQERIKPGSEISQILIVGGGANMPGFGDYLTNATHIATRLSSPWGGHLTFGNLEPPESADLPRFLTCAGSAMASDKEVFGV
ncbi:pilus assembly protein PilM [Candidatus Saccharibacteria bacterium]|nr:pilus assembly protein PilM [Candidatus Saccharibacteria bacterium]